MAGNLIIIDPEAMLPEFRRRLCSNCEHGLLGSGGTYCRLFHEDIWNDRTAEDCEHFELQ